MPQTVALVASEMVERPVEGPEKSRSGRHEQKQSATRAQALPGDSRQFPVVLDVFQHVDENHGIHGAAEIVIAEVPLERPYIR